MTSPGYEAVEVGTRWQSTGRTLTEADLSWSCMSSGDWHPIHADEEFARSTPAGRRIFQGTFGLHVAAGLATAFPQLGDDVLGALGFSDWRFLQPLYVGDTLHVEVEITGKRVSSSAGRGVIERHIRLVKHDGVIAQEGRAALLARTGVSE